MKTQTIKSTPKELILPTTKLLDLLIPILSIINPQKSNNRKKVNAYIYRNWRDPNKINVTVLTLMRSAIVLYLL